MENPWPLVNTLRNLSCGYVFVEGINGRVSTGSFTRRHW